MAFRVSVDLAARRIRLLPEGHPHPPLRVREDLYSDLKEMWRANVNGEAKFAFPFDTTGGDPISATLNVGAYFFLRNDLGWRIQPHGDAYGAEVHEVVFLGNLYPKDEGLPLFVPAPGGATVFARVESSSLTQVVQVGGSGPQEANVVQIDGQAAPAQNLAKSAGVMVPGIVDTAMFTPSLTQFETNIVAFPLEDHFKSRIVFWRTGALAKSAYEITAYRRIGGRGRFTVTTMVAIPVSGDEFVIL